MNNRLTRNNRISKPSEYRAVFKSGKIEKSEHWTVIAKPNALAMPRLGLAISKKVCRLAVNRNRLKRLAREVFRDSKNYLLNCEFVVLSRGHSSASNAALSSDLNSLLHKFNKA